MTQLLKFIQKVMQFMAPAPVTQEVEGFIKRSKDVGIKYSCYWAQPGSLRSEADWFTWQQPAQ